MRRAYDTGDFECDVLHDFYVPVLTHAVSYDRLTGYFTSGSLAVAARGIAGLVKTGGYMRIATSPTFSPADLTSLQTTCSDSEVADIVELATLDSLSLDDLTDEIARNHVRALGWLLANGRLEIKVVVPRTSADATEGIFHQKVGILRDLDHNLVSFSGSVNETAAGWSHNVEEFKVFRSWLAGELEWVNHDSAMFSKYWNGASSGFRSLDLPEATRLRLVSYAPANFEGLDLGPNRTKKKGSSQRPACLREYQSAAVEAWFANGCRGILEMATGTGKTKTAIACITEHNKRRGPGLTVITVPYQHIGVQWAEELEPFKPVCTFRESNWRKAMANLVADVKLGLRDAATIVTTDATGASDDFLEYVDELSNKLGRATLIGDEVHGLGAPTLRRALSNSYDSRLGLSATPQRWFDDEGSAVLNKYFGDTVYTFGIREALNWIDPETGQSVLCPYHYHPIFVGLDDEELRRYAELTEKIVKQLQYNDDPESNEQLELLLFKRAAIVKTASAKIGTLRKLLPRLGELSHALIYCHASEQMDDVCEVLRDQGVRYHHFTGAEGTTPSAQYKGLSEREWILHDLAEGNTQTLVAMKCLDEGVDVPAARIGVILASSGNPREFIQRRGRLLRRAPGKTHAEIYDLIVRPGLEALLDPIARKLELKIFRKELERIDEFAKDADNALEGRNAVLKVLTELI